MRLKVVAPLPLPVISVGLTLIVTPLAGFEEVTVRVKLASDATKSAVWFESRGLNPCPVGLNVNPDEEGVTR